MSSCLTAPLTMVVSLALLGPALAQDRSRQADEDACRPDVFRLCAAEIPDEGAIVDCLGREAPRLSPACRAVIVPERVVPKRRAGRAR